MKLASEPCRAFAGATALTTCARSPPPHSLFLNRTRCRPAGLSSSFVDVVEPELVRSRAHVQEGKAQSLGLLDDAQARARTHARKQQTLARRRVQHRTVAVSFSPPPRHGRAGVEHTGKGIKAPDFASLYSLVARTHTSGHLGHPHVVASACLLAPARPRHCCGPFLPSPRFPRPSRHVDARR